MIVDDADTLNENFKILTLPKKNNELLSTKYGQGKRQKLVNVPYTPESSTFKRKKKQVFSESHNNKNVENIHSLNKITQKLLHHLDSSKSKGNDNDKSLDTSNIILSPQNKVRIENKKQSLKNFKTVDDMNEVDSLSTDEDENIPSDMLPAIHRKNKRQFTETLQSVEKKTQQPSPTKEELQLQIKELLKKVNSKKLKKAHVRPITWESTDDNNDKSQKNHDTITSRYDDHRSGSEDKLNVVFYNTNLWFDHSSEFAHDIAITKTSLPSIRTAMAQRLGGLRREARKNANV
ncbi:hypothetical protein HCN44_005946 [Aphidius gifuensis]|uniref:Uncharacterized protein n=1 Tax=Aphidius gifuensis TaxID=684658 RepID=A0A834XZT1_APHGI|nr:hypothetical protein HCN44_005946 [Aphidius gifuensis]